jgi:ubiquinone/menaquinone biosynthesis C-methylase UbiE
VRAADWDEKWRGRLDEHRHAELTGRPSRFLVSAVEGSEPGRALDLACGAGRHAVWLAERGWQVTAVDFSETALAEARRLAAARNVAVEWIAADVLAWEPPAHAFELVLLLYLQVPGHELRAALRRAARALAPGGRLVVVGHHSDNLEHGHGGPSSAAVLYTEADIEARLEGLEIERAERVRRPVESADAERHAIDAVVVAAAPR